MYVVENRYNISCGRAGVGVNLLFDSVFDLFTENKQTIKHGRAAGAEYIRRVCIIRTDRNYTDG